MTTRRQSKSRGVDVHRPRDAHRGMSPLSLAIRIEKDAAREARSRGSVLELLQRATPAQILEASKGATGPSSTPADVAAAWERLRKAVT